SANYLASSPLSLASRVRRPLDVPPARFRRTRMKVGFITLRCAKNKVGSESYLAQLADRGAEYTDDLADAEVIVINTCGFIDAAKKESLDAIVEAGRMKDDGRCQAVVAVGCMVQRPTDALVEGL